MSIVSGVRSGVRSTTRSGLNPAAASLTTWALEKTGGVSGTYDAQAYSNETFTGATSLQFTIVSTLFAHCVGLSTDNPDANYTGIDFGLLNDTGTVYRAENGVLTLLSVTVATDVWKITRAADGAVTYYKNGALASTSANATAAALRVDSSFRFANDRVTNLTVTTTGAQPLTFTTSGITATGAA